uniref:RNase H type-1 domain-containing protein n=1 Tax=Cannabis sativa TaxID=3483 RepID=A0A803NHF9_CANSA
MPYYKQIRESKGCSMFDLLVEFRHQLSKEEFEEVIKILWAIWENRNRQWNKLPVMDGARLIDWVLNSYPNSARSREKNCRQMPTPATNQACPIDNSNFFEIRTDCKRLVDEFKEEGSNLSDVSLVFNKIKRHQRFPFCTKLNFVNRNHNEIAHKLSKRSLENKLN